MSHQIDPLFLDVREQLANYAHSAWSGWMKYQFSKAELQPDGTWIMPAWAVERWTRQMNTPYAELPEDEKASDRKEADEMLAIVSPVALRVQNTERALLLDWLRRELAEYQRDDFDERGNPEYDPTWYEGAISVLEEVIEEVSRKAGKA